MYYYIVVGGMIVDCSLPPPAQATLQRWANEQDADVYVLFGKPTGQTAEPPDRRPTKTQQAELLAEEFSRKES